MAHSYHTFSILKLQALIFTAYGPWGRLDMGSNSQKLSGEEIEVFDGKMVRDFVYRRYCR